MITLKKGCLFIFLALNGMLLAQLSYDANRIYSLRKVVPTYTGAAIQCSCPCRPAFDVGFSTCGDLDTMAIYNQYWKSYPLTYLFNTSAAYSLRKLSCGTYTNCIRVRSSAAGSPTTDIGFTTSGDLDTVALKAFVGSNSAFVTIWYDQSGNGRDASQSVTTDQPRIVNAGSIEKQNGRPAIYFQDASDQLQTASFSAYNTAAFFNLVAKTNTTTGNTILSKTGSSSANRAAPLDFNENGVWTGNESSISFWANSQAMNASQPLGIWSIQQQLSATTCSLNGTSVLNAGASGGFGDAGAPLCIGKRRDGGGGVIGWIQEVVSRGGTVLNSNSIRALEYSQSLYYGINGPSLSVFQSFATPDFFVLKWYDQSGNNLHASSAGTAPKISTFNLLQYNSGKPALKFDGTSSSFTATGNTNAFSNVIGGGTYLSVFGRYNYYGSTSSSNKPFAYQGTQSSGGLCWGIAGSSDVFSPSVWFANFCTSPGNMVSSVNTSVSTISDIIQIGGAFTNYYVNGSIVNFSGAFSNANTGLFRIGQYDNYSQYLDGYINEVQLFDNNIGHTRRMLLESNHAAYYNISIGSQVYTPPAANSYNRYVLGVGRITTTDSLAGTRRTVGMGFKVGNTASDFLKDNGDFITAGSGCPTSSASTASNCPAGIMARWVNDWYINKTDVNANGGKLQVYFDFSDNGVASTPGMTNYYELLYRNGTSGNYSIVPGTTVTVSGDQVLFALDANTLVSNYYYTIGTHSAMQSPLPVQLQNFIVLKENGQVRLSWATVSEHNANYFVVQRLKSNEEFEDMARPIKAAGHSDAQHSYSLMDENPLPGINYYRLKQVDNDQSITYSEIKMVEFGDDFQTAIYPNPGKGLYTIVNCRDYARLFIRNMLGQVVYHQQINSNRVYLDLTDLPNGLYYVELRKFNDEDTKLLKLVKHE